MRINNILKFISIIMLLGFTIISAQKTLEEYIAEGDAHYLEFNNNKALEVFEKANEAYPDNWEIMWRLSRTLVDIGEHMPASTSKQEEEQIKMYEKALEFADKSVQLAPNESITYLRRAIANGRIALFKGVFSVGGIVTSVKEDCEKAIELNTGGPEVQGIAHYVLARTHAKVSEKWAPARAVIGLSWGDIDIALEEFKKAVKLKPNYVMIYVDYAIALMSEDMYEEAKVMLTKALESPIQDEDDETRKTEAQELLKEVNAELD